MISMLFLIALFCISPVQKMGNIMSLTALTKSKTSQLKTHEGMCDCECVSVFIFSGVWSTEGSNLNVVSSCAHRPK